MSRLRPDLLRRLAAAALLAALAALAGCGPGRARGDADVLRVSQRNEPATLDPHLATLPDELFVLRAVLEGLTVPDPAGGPALPGAAESWTASDDFRRFTFRLRADGRWADGTPVTAADFLYSFRRALTPALASPRADLFHAVRNAAAYRRGELGDFAEVGFSAPDERTLVVETTEPTPHLPAIAASGAWLPVHRASVEAAGGTAGRDGGWTRPGSHVGNGPFLLAEWRPSQHLLLQPNPRHRDAARVRVGAVRLQVYDSGDTEERAFRAGQVDITMSVPAAKLPAYAPPVLRRQPLHETRHLVLNLARPPLGDPRVRQALSLALDRDALVTHVLRGGQQVAHDFIPPGLGGYAGGPRLRRDPEEARRLLAAAGYPGGKGFPPLELSAWGVSAGILEALQQMWRRELGIETPIVQREGKVHLAAVAAGDFDLAFLPAIPDFDDPAALLEDWRSGAPGNYARWSNPTYDRLVTAAARAADPAARRRLQVEAEEVLLGELPLIPVYFNAQNYLVAPRVRGWRQDALWNRFYLDVSLDPVR
jgi:oligopeptide transport system substrate-binding protein